MLALPMRMCNRSHAANRPIRSVQDRTATADDAAIADLESELKMKRDVRW